MSDETGLSSSKASLTPDLAGEGGRPQASDRLCRKRRAPEVDTADYSGTGSGPSPRKRMCRDDIDLCFEKTETELPASARTVTDADDTEGSCFRFRGALATSSVCSSASMDLRDRFRLTTLSRRPAHRTRHPPFPSRLEVTAGDGVPIHRVLHLTRRTMRPPLSPWRLRGRRLHHVRRSVRGRLWAMV